MGHEPSYLRIRIPPDLKEFIRESAAHNERSLNGEIVFALRERQKAASAHTA